MFFTFVITVQGERNYIMQVVCEATQSAAVQVQVGAFEALVRIMTLYYEKMGFYMERALFGVRVCVLACQTKNIDFLPQLTVMGMKHSEEAIALQAIEFWSTVAETEAELNWEAADVRIVTFSQFSRSILFRMPSANTFNYAGPGIRRSAGSRVAKLRQDGAARNPARHPEPPPQARP